MCREHGSQQVSHWNLKHPTKRMRLHSIHAPLTSWAHIEVRASRKFLAMGGGRPSCPGRGVGASDEPAATSWAALLINAASSSARTW